MSRLPSSTSMRSQQHPVAPSPAATYVHSPRPFLVHPPAIHKSSSRNTPQLSSTSAKRCWIMLVTPKERPGRYSGVASDVISADTTSTPWLGASAEGTITSQRTPASTVLAPTCGRARPRPVTRDTCVQVSYPGGVTHNTAAHILLCSLCCCNIHNVAALLLLPCYCLLLLPSALHGWVALKSLEGTHMSCHISWCS